MAGTRRYRPGGGRSVIESSAFTILQDRYRISKESLIGEGGFAKVYRGLDTKECTGVAVKVYNSTDDITIESFMKSVKVLSKLHKIQVSGLETEEPNSPDSSPMMKNTLSYKPAILKKNLASMKSVGDLGAVGVTDKAMRELNFADCFVKLLGFSMDSQGHPGLDIETETYFLVFELGDSSLDEVLAKCKCEGNTLSTHELRSLHWALVSIVCGLHNDGYVHLDIKPVNIVRFGAAHNGCGKAQWKLIDLDGAMKTGSEVLLSDVVYTPQYMPPELAKACLTARSQKKNGEDTSQVPLPGAVHDEADRVVHCRDPKARLKLSRLMDIWSVGLCALEAIFLTPVLDPWYSQWMEETGSDTKFTEWLGDTATDPIISGSMQGALNEIDRDMCRFLKGMLAKDPRFRLSITELVNHTWLKPIRMEIQEDIDEIIAREITASTKTVGFAHDDDDYLLSSDSRVVATGTEKARIVAKGVVTRTCVTM